MSKVDSSSIVAELEEGTCDGVLRFVERLDVVIGEVCIILGTLKRNTYTREHITRSLLVAGLASSQGKIDWSQLHVSPSADWTRDWTRCYHIRSHFVSRLDGGNLRLRSCLVAGPFDS